MWKDIIKSELTEDEIEDFVFQIEDIIENIVAKMFKKKYEGGRHNFGDYVVDIRKTSLTVPEMAAVSNRVFKYEFEYDDGQMPNSLIFASCFIAGTDDGKINDLFFDTTDSELYIENSIGYIPNIKEKIAQIKGGLRELLNRV